MTILPTEIWQMIANGLSQRDLLNLRLQNRHINDVATPLAFAELYIGWMPHYLDSLEALSRSPLRNFISTVHIEMDMVRSYYGPRDWKKWIRTKQGRRWANSQPRGERTAEHVMNWVVENQQRRYESQSRVLEIDTDWRDSSESLFHDSRARVVTYLSRFSAMTALHLVSSADLAIAESLDDQVTTYQGQQLRRLQDYRWQAQQDEPFLRVDHAEYATLTAWLNYTTLLAALAGGQNLRELSFCCMPWNIFNYQPCEDEPLNATLEHTISAAVMNLTTLKLGIVPSPVESTFFDDDEPDPEIQLSWLINYAKSVVNLTLDISFGQFYYYSLYRMYSNLQQRMKACWQQDKVLGETCLPHLRKLTISHLCLQPKTFTAFMERHASTLKEIDLGQVDLREDDWDESMLQGALHGTISAWEEACKRLAPIMTLEKVELEFILDAWIRKAVQRQCQPPIIPGRSYDKLVWQNSDDYAKAVGRYLRSKGQVEYPDEGGMMVWREDDPVFEDEEND